MVTQATQQPRLKADSAVSEAPLFHTIAQGLEHDILTGTLTVGAQAPSTNEIASFHGVNPATALRALQYLAERGVLYKRRGVGMFVAAQAREALLAERHASFGDRFVIPLLAEAKTLGLSVADIVEQIEEAGRHEH